MAKPGFFQRMAGRFGKAAPEQPRAKTSTPRKGPRAVYDGASYGRRAANWSRNGFDANRELNPAAIRALREIARELLRNNPYAARAVAGIAEQVVGAGITFQVYRNGKIDQALTDLARKHFDSTDCDASGQHNLYGLQLLSLKTIPTSGSIVWRRRWRRATDGLTVPFQIQVIEPDYINTTISAPSTNGGYRLQGVEVDAIGRRTGYWMYSGHPGGLTLGSLETKLIPATEIAHCYRSDRPEQMHGATWFSPVIVRLKDFGDYEDAQLVRQKIAACFTVFRIGDPEGDPESLLDSNGEALDEEPNLTAVEPGIIESLPAGTTVEFADPPGVDGYEPYSRVSVHAIATGLGIPYEMFGDLSQVSFISGRLGRLQFKRSVETWQWQMTITQLCEPAGQWFLDAAAMQGVDVKGASFKWTPPLFEMMSPETEIPANRDAVRSGQKTLSQLCRERGEDPDVFFTEVAADNAILDRLGIIFDSDPRHVSQVGNAVILDPAALDKKGTK